MSKAAVTLFAFAIYLALTGIAFLVAPTFTLGMLGFAEATEPWVRVIGMLLLFLAFYYGMAARSEITIFFKWTVYVRSSVIVFFGIIVLVGLGQPMLLAFAVIDLAAAIWTAMALRSAA